MSRLSLLFVFRRQCTLYIHHRVTACSSCVSNIHRWTRITRTPTRLGLGSIHWAAYTFNNVLLTAGVLSHIAFRALFQDFSVHNFIDWQCFNDDNASIKFISSRYKYNEEIIYALARVINYSGRRLLAHVIHISCMTYPRVFAWCGKPMPLCLRPSGSSVGLKMLGKK